MAVAHETTYSKLAWALACAVALLAPGLIGTENASGQAADAIRFGLDHESLAAQAALGVKADYASIWIGAWSLRDGYGPLDHALEGSTANGVTPLVHFYYWGNDISRVCVDAGCQTASGWKSRDGWNQLAGGLVDHLWAKRDGKPAVIVVETEFNKNDVTTYEPLDGYLASVIGTIKSGYPAATLVLGFGNWGSANWGTFDRAAGASHMVGLQGMRASTRDTQTSYYTVDDDLLAGSRRLQSLFHKPILITDVALSSYPDGTYAAHQRAVLSSIFGKTDDYRAAGVRGLVYRTLDDDLDATTNEYYGEAERHFGLRWADGGWKPAMTVWADGVRAERARTAGSPAPTSTGSWSVGPSAAVFRQAESFATKTAGGMQADSGASQGQRWTLWSNGVLGQDVQVATSGHYWFSVRANGQRLDGVAPHMVVSVDRQTLLQADPAGGYRFASAHRWLDAGTHRLEIAYTNDAVRGGGDRNLLVDTVTVAPLWKFEAESMATKSTGRWESDATALGGARWNLWGNGHAQHWLTLGPGTYDLRVRAKGSPLDGVAPKMTVTLDGGQARTFDVGSAYAAYTGPVTLSWSGSHAIKLAFTNDAANARGDRNLFLDSVEIVRRP